MKRLNILILFFITTILFLISELSIAQTFSASPDVLKFDLKQPKTQTITINNTGKERLTLTIRPRAYNSKVLNIGRPLNRKAIQQSNLTPYVIVSPRTITLRPRQKRMIRISTRIPPNAKPGSYYGHIAIYPAERPKMKLKKGTTGVAISTALGLAIHANYGTGHPKLNVNCGKNSKGKLVLNITNTTVWLYSGNLKIYDNYKGKNTLLKKMTMVTQRQSKNTLIFPDKFSPKGKLMVTWASKAPLDTSGRAICSK